MMTPFNLIQSLRSWFFARDGDIVLQDGRAIKISNADITITTGGIVITGGTVTIGGAAVSVAGHVHTHASTTSQTTDDHHPQSHNVASHSDTSATGTELNTLTDGSDAAALHIHDARYFQESEFVSTATSGAPLEADSNGGLAVERLGVNTAIPGADGVLDIGGYIQLDEISAPSTPSSGNGIIYFDTASQLTTKNDSGTVANFYPTSAFSANPGAASAPLISDSNGDITLKTITSSDAGVSFDAAGSVYIASAGVLRMGERSTPGTPPSGNMYIYPKTDGRLYYKNDGGTEYGPL